MRVRPETVSDHGAIRTVIANAFGTLEEARLVDDLRADGDLTLSLVAVEDQDICGHVALSRMRAPPSSLALAPLAVRPAWQRRGIGTRLVEGAIAAARHQGCGIVFVLGDPEFYGRFGFSRAAAAPFPSRYSGPHFMAIVLGTGSPKAGVACHAPAFDCLG